MCRLIIKKLLTLTGVQFAALFFQQQNVVQAKARCFFMWRVCKIRKWAEMDRDLAAGCRLQQVVLQCKTWKD